MVKCGQSHVPDPRTHSQHTQPPPPPPASWIGGVCRGQLTTSHLCKCAHTRLVIDPSLTWGGASYACVSMRGGGGSGPHGKERGKAMIEKCIQRGLASCGLKLHYYIWSR